MPDSTPLTEVQIGYTKDRFEAIYLLVKYKQLFWWILSLVGALAGPALATAVYARNAAASIANSVLSPDVVKNFEANAARAEMIVDGLLPIGTIIAWHKEVETKRGLSAGALPGVWVECNGPIKPGTPEFIEDSVADLGHVPDLNGGARFLRGGHTSGIPQDATLVPVVAEMGENELIFGAWAPGAPYKDEDSIEPDNPQGRMSVEATRQGSPDNRIRAIRVRPTNMSVVWIMRVK